MGRIQFFGTSISLGLSQISENLYSQLTTKQQKIALITSIALGILTAIAFVYHFFFANSSFSISSLFSRAAIHRSEEHKDIIDPGILINELEETQECIDLDPELYQTVEDRSKFDHQMNASSQVLLTNIEKKIARIDGAIMQKNVPSLGIEPNQDSLMIDLQKQLAKHLKLYLKILSQYLNDHVYTHIDETTLPKKEYSVIKPEVKQKVFTHICQFCNKIHRYRQWQGFILDGFKLIDAFLDNKFFISKTKRSLFEQQKDAVSLFHPFFYLTNTYYEVLETDLSLKINLKIKLANLPLPGSRSKYPKIYLSQRDQLEILSKHFQDQENRLIDSITTINFNLCDVKELRKLVKMVSKDRSYLSDSNRAKLQNILMNSYAAQSVQDWDQFEELWLSFTKNWNLDFQDNICFYHPAKSFFGLLHRISKAKNFFLNQKGLSEKDIQIPFFYHATKPENLKGIINKNGIQSLQHGFFQGAWVSTEWEEAFGTVAVILNPKIMEKDPSPSIQLEHGDKIWRGIQKTIPLCEEKLRYIVYLGVKNKSRAPIYRSLLKKRGIKNVNVLSFHFVKAIQQAFREKIGKPNLPSKWWGKDRAEVSKII